MEPGAKVGAYRLLRELARGGMGAVWHAVDPQGREVALKLVLEAGAADHRERLLREALALARLRHPHVVQVLDAGQAGRTPFLVMELVPAESLAERLARGGPLPVREAVSLTRKLAGAVAHAHAHGVLHRDIKPQNVLIRPGGEPALTDFGLSRDVDLEEGRTRTQTGRFMGTPGYFAPEQARGEGRLMSPATDVYGLGALFFALLTGKPPQGTARTMLEALSLATRPVTPPSRLRAEVDPALDAICLRALAVEPSQRHPSAAALEEELARWLRGAQPVQAPRRGLARAAVGGAVLLGAALVVLAGGSMLRGRSTPPVGELSPVGGSLAPVATGREPDPSLALLDRPWRLAARAAQGEAERREFEAALEALRAASERLLGSDLEDPGGLACQAALREAQGDLAGAEELLRRALARRPEWGALHQTLGRVLIGRGDDEAARGSLDRALELDPRDPNALLARGVLRERAGDMAGALADLERASVLRPDDALVWFNLGSVRQQGGDWPGALRDYSRALAQDPDLTDARFNRALGRMERGEDEAALDDLDEVLRRAPAHLRALIARGKLLEERGAPEGALADFVQASQVAPDEPEAWAGRVTCRSALGRWAEALPDADRWVALHRTPQALFVRGAVREVLGDGAGAEADYRACLAQDPLEELAGQAREALARVAGR